MKMRRTRFHQRAMIRLGAAALRKDYLERGWTLERLAQRYGVAPSTVWLRMREADIPLRRRGYRRPVPAKEELSQLYLQKGVTIARLASHYRAAISTVTRWLKTYAIPRRKGAPPTKLRGREMEIFRLHSHERLLLSAIASVVFAK